jgi:DNA-binding PadR family transcriptional regulator
MAGTPDAVDETPNPLDQQREVMDLLSQETRHQIIQVILGHPAHLPSADELDYFIADKTKKSITDQLDRLQNAGIIEEYTSESNRSTRGLPWKFYGPTDHGIDVLGEFNYLRGVPMARAIIKKTRTTEKIDRHMQAPRPSLPPAIQDALRLDNESEES